MRDRRPDFELMTDERYTRKVPALVDSDLMFKTRKDFRNDVHYIGIFADVVSNAVTYICTVTRFVVYVPNTVGCM